LKPRATEHVGTRVTWTTPTSQVFLREKFAAADVLETVTQAQLVSRFRLVIVGHDVDRVPADRVG